MIKDNFSNIEFTDLIDVETIQRFQDSFSDATGVASIITKPDGTPITKPSNFCSLCLLIRKTKKGLANCHRSDSIIGRQNLGGPIYQKCLSGGLWDGGASILVGGKHIANWLIGQVLNKDSDENKILDYAKEIGADEIEFKNELQKVTRMPVEQFKKIVTSLYIFANELSDKAYQNLQLKIHQENLEFLVKEKTEDLETVNEELQANNEELYTKNEIINEKNIQLEETLRNLKETQLQLLEANKMASIGILTAGVAHEINNPLNYIMGGYVGLDNYFKKFGSSDSKKTSKLLSGIYSGIEKATNIVKGLNQFSRDNSNYNEECDIQSILDNCLVILQNLTKHRIEIRKTYLNESPIIKGNVGKLHQVFTNILTNSIHAIKEVGEISIETKIVDSFINIVITDTGSGIKAEHISNVVDPFFTTKSPGEGTGLGLSISYSIIKEHKGTIEFESEYNKGTKVTIKIPYKN